MGVSATNRRRSRGTCKVSYLRSYPDHDAVEKTLHGIKKREPIGFRGRQQLLTAQIHVMKKPHVCAIDVELAKLLGQGTVLSPFKKHPTEAFRSSLLKVDPKIEEDLRVCHNLSSPIGRSFNDCLRK